MQGFIGADAVGEHEVGGDDDDGAAAAGVALDEEFRPGGGELANGADRGLEGVRAVAIAVDEGKSADGIEAESGGIGGFQFAVEAEQGADTARLVEWNVRGVEIVPDGDAVGDPVHRRREDALFRLTSAVFKA